MILSASAVVVFCGIVVFLIRRGNIRWHYALLCMLAGFYLAKTSSAPVIDRTVQQIADLFASIRL